MVLSEVEQASGQKKSLWPLGQSKRVTAAATPGMGIGKANTVVNPRRRQKGKHALKQRWLQILPSSNGLFFYYYF